MASPADPADYVALTQLKHRYCHYIDLGRYEDWVDLFAEDGAFARPGGDAFEGHDELLEFAADVFDEQYDYSAHLVCNPVLEVDGDGAIGWWYLYLLFDRGGNVGWMQGRYDDEYRRVDGGWKIASSEVVPDASTSREHTLY